MAALIPKRRSPGVGPPDGYEIHDYLDQHGRTKRRWALTPDSLWDALVAHTTDPLDRLSLSRSAYHRLRYRHADPLYRTASTAVPARSRRDMLEVLGRHGRIAELVDGMAEDAHTSQESLLDLLDRDPSPYRREIRAHLAHRFPSRFGRLLVDDLLAAGQVDEAIDLLRRWIGAEGGRASEWLADVLADQDRWPEALEVVRSSGRGWTMRWLAERLGRAGNVEQLRRLAEAGSIEAHQHLAAVAPDGDEHPPPVDDLSLTMLGEELPFSQRLLARLTGRLAAAGRQDAAITALRELLTRVEPPDSWYVTETLAGLLAARGRHEELLDRTRKGDEHCARQLVALAHGGKVANGERLLAEGL